MMDLILAKLGFDPENIKKQVDDAAANFEKVIKHFNGRLDVIEHKLDAVLKFPVHSHVLDRLPIDVINNSPNGEETKNNGQPE